MIILRYKWHIGSVAWIIHRLSGIALTLYIFAHLYVLSNLRDPEKFQQMIALTHNPIVKLMEVGLVGVVAAHMLNGLRLTLMDLGTPTRMHKCLAWCSALVCAVSIVVAGVVFLGGAQ